MTTRHDIASARDAIETLEIDDVLDANGLHLTPEQRLAQFEDIWRVVGAYGMRQVVRHVDIGLSIGLSRVTSYVPPRGTDQPFPSATSPRARWVPPAPQTHERNERYVERVVSSLAQWVNTNIP